MFDTQSIIKKFTDMRQQLNQLKTVCDTQLSQINDRNNQITMLNGQIKTLQTDNENKDMQIQSLQPIAQQLPQIKAQLAQALSDRSSCLISNANQNIVINNLKASIQAGIPKGFWNRVWFLLGK